MKRWIFRKKRAEILEILLALAELGALIKPIEISTNKLAKILDMSQQSASRKLREMEKEGLISREITALGEKIRIRNAGISLLLEYHDRLCEIFRKIKPGIMVLKGVVVRGLGEGRYYMALKGYVAQIKEKLGFKPYPGTLNLKLKNTEDILKRIELQRLPGILIKGFLDGVRTYGDVKAFKAEINGIKPLAVVLPERTSHGIDIIEVIGPFNIREKLGLKNGDEVSLIIYLQ